MMSGDRTVQVGGAILALGAGVVLARLGYVWATPHSHFLGLWPVLGLIVGALGLVVMLIGWVMPGDKSASPSQVQKSGDRSNNLQAGRDIILNRDTQGE
jgi:hypothetical protein